MFLNYTTLLKIGLRSMMKISLQFLGHQNQNGNGMSVVSSKTTRKVPGFCVTVMMYMSV